MIYTVTFNPSLDYIIRVNDFSTGTINKTTFEKCSPWRKRNECIQGWLLKHRPGLYLDLPEKRSKLG